MDNKDLKPGRLALDPGLILSESARSSSKWREIEVLGQVSSTNDIVLARLVDSAPDAIFSVTADEQLQGRGRLQREWRSPFGAGIALSIAIPTKVFGCPISAIPLLIGVAANTCLIRRGVAAKLKWPNDLMIVSGSGELKKVGGILVQLQSDRVVVGIGINTHLQAEELPTESATSLSLIGLDVSREVLICEIISEIQRLTQEPNGVWHKKYLSMSCTLGQDITVKLTGHSDVSGLVKSITNLGALDLETEQGLTQIIAGDVLQVRPRVNPK